MSAEDLQVLELISTVLLILYVILIAFEKKIAWPIGILGSAIGAYVFYESQYQAEAFLYLYYVAAGFYGWYVWGSTPKTLLNIKEWPTSTHIITVISGVALTFGLAKFIGFVFPDNPRPLVDSFTTMFAFIATYMQIKKIYSNWYYWIIINTVTIYLFFSKNLDYYGILAIVNTVLAIAGAYSWYKRKNKLVP